MRMQPIPELAVVDLVRVRDGRPEILVGVVLDADDERDFYTVELVKTNGGKEIVAASSSDLHVRHVI